MFRGHFLKMLSHGIRSINISFNIMVMILCVGVGFGIAAISGVLQGDPMRKGVKQPAEGIFGAAGLALEHGELAAQALQYMSAVGDTAKQEEIKKNMTAQYSRMDEKNTAQLKKIVKEKYSDKIEEIKKTVKDEGLP